jgi:hypothetical protein
MMMKKEKVQEEEEKREEVWGKRDIIGMILSLWLRQKLSEVE